MPRAKKNPDDPASKGENQRCHWSVNDNNILVRVLREQKDAGNLSGAGWKSQVWTVVQDALKAQSSSGAVVNLKTGKKCSDHWANLKKNFIRVHAVRYASGFGWDEDRKVPVATKEYWDCVIAKTPDAIRWKTTPFPLYDEVHYLVNGVVATEDSALIPGQTLPSSRANLVSSNEDQESQEDKEATSTSTSTSKTSSQLSVTFDDDIEETSRPRTPLSSSRKRAQADSESDSQSPTKSSSSAAKKRRGGKHGTSQADSISGMTNAIVHLSQLMSGGNGVPTPVRRQKAIELLLDDAEFSDNEEGDLLLLFAENVGYADTYAATRKKTARVKFAQTLLSQKFNN